MRWIGARSYSFYLVHQPVLVAIAFSWAAVGISAGVRLAVILPSAFAVSLASAAVSYRYFERPFLRMRKRTVRLPEPPGLGGALAEGG
jgi:peptidoglycan/LPS O-acetylase OafA/YrhL